MSRDQFWISRLVVMTLVLKQAAVRLTNLLDGFHSRPVGAQENVTNREEQDCGTH